MYYYYSLVKERVCWFLRPAKPVYFFFFRSRQSAASRGPGSPEETENTPRGRPSVATSERWTANEKQTTFTSLAHVLKNIHFSNQNKYSLDDLQQSSRRATRARASHKAPPKLDQMSTSFRFAPSVRLGRHGNFCKLGGRLDERIRTPWHSGTSIKESD